MARTGAVQADFFKSIPKLSTPTTYQKEIWMKPLAIPDVLPERLPSDPTVQKSSGGDQNPVIPPTSPK